MPAGMVAFAKLREVVAADSDLGLAGVKEPAKLASIYKKMAASKHPNLDSVEVTKKAEELFKSDSLENKKKHLATARREMAEKKSAKKEAKASYSETSE